MSLFGAGNRGSEFGGINNEFSLGHDEFELVDWNTGLVPEEMGLQRQREVEGLPEEHQEKQTGGPSWALYKHSP